MFARSSPHLFDCTAPRPRHGRRPRVAAWRPSRLVTACARALGTFVVLTACAALVSLQASPAQAQDGARRAPELVRVGSRYERPPEGSLQRGALWLRRPRVGLALGLAATAGVLAAGLRRRLREETRRA